jgi:hypothetical protein
MRKQFSGQRRFVRTWNCIEQKLIRRKGPTGDEYWLSVPAGDVLHTSAVTDIQLNREWYEAIPAILTGTGLLVTFIAILVALLHVRLVGNRVEGMALLIEGLSGKFVSSIAALFAATLFVMVEKTQFHSLDSSISKLSDAIAAVIPALAPTHLLVELQRDMTEQSVAFRSFNADLSGRLKQSFSESMGPRRADPASVALHTFWKSSRSISGSHNAPNDPSVCGSTNRGIRIENCPHCERCCSTCP